ncbi:hypothetical protein AAF712_016417 [Marasmius tenuissimus]|uniref:Uncharacterized protein n=1 Tax=Marasmius tenuissimus TaxID=585030 RepID=A0ABR2Z6Q3_9AGAR
MRTAPALSTPSRKRPPLTSLNPALHNSPEAKRIRTLQNHGGRISEKRKSATKASKKISDHYESGLEESQVESQVWLESISGDFREFSGNPGLLPSDNSSDENDDAAAIDEQILCDIEPVSTEWIKTALAGKQTISATRLMNEMATQSTNETIRKLKATIENMAEDAENKRRCMDIVVRAKNRAVRAKEEADNRFQEAENQRRAAETGRIEAENRRIDAEIGLMKAEAMLRKRDDDHAIEVERLSMAALNAKRDAGLFRIC